MSGTPRLRVWDLPTRLFHWALALLVVCSVVTAQVGGLWMDWHLRAGYAALALLLFRLLWGVFGSRYARFTQFVRGPSAVLAYLRALRTGGAAPQAGHNPLGALSVLAMLAALLVQAATGLFANDAIATEGPLAKFVSGSTSDLLTRIHKLNQYVLYALVALHVAAIAFYRVIKREDLLRPMITGDRTGVAGEPARDDLAMRLRAALLLALAAGAVAYLVTR